MGETQLEEEEQEDHCKFWLPKKKRFCSSTLLVGDSKFCGNHLPRSDGQWVPCPLDPSHPVLKDNLEGHLRRCPFLERARSLSDQPYYIKGVNSGREGPGDDSDEVTCEMKRNYVHGLTPVGFFNLVEKVESIHRKLCEEGIRDSFKVPEACNAWISREIDRNLPFQEKHVTQQASILGNLEEFGVLKSSVEGEQCNGGEECGGSVDTVVEFGAGRGYLTQVLADSFGIKRVFLVERKAYKLKADRSLRQKESLILERLRIDIEDLNLNAVSPLQEVPYLAIGKHLCGPATDLTLRCCFSRQVKNNGSEFGGKNYLRGLAIATCCHHLVQWKHYTNKQVMTNLGISKEEFHAITWFTSWAVDADHSSELTDIAESTTLLRSIEEERSTGDGNGVEGMVKNLRPAERAALGFKCKQIIDMGRMIWVKEQGLDVQLVKYVPASVSPENHLLVAKVINSL